MHTSMRVSRENRDALARIATEDLGGATLDEALRTVLFEHQTRAALERLAADPEGLADYVAEARDLAEADTKADE